MNRYVWLAAAVLTVLLLAFNNILYYFYTKETLERDLSREMRAVAEHIQVSVELSRTASEKFQEQLGVQLRTAAIAAQFALDPDVENVSNDELVTLSRLLGIQHITLLKETEDDIILYRSSDPTQIGFPTASWDPWHQAFRQLLADRRVTIDWGQSLENFWTGPYEFASTDVGKIRKWGYYYNGGTNYIIDPYIGYDVQRQFDEATGAGRLVRESMEGNPSLLEVAGLNAYFYDKGPRRTTTVKGEELLHVTQQPVIFGMHELHLPGDAANVHEAFETGRIVMDQGEAGGKTIVRLYMPVDIETLTTSILDDHNRPAARYVLAVTSDYAVIQERLDNQFAHMGLIVGGATLLSAAVVFAVLRYVRRSQDRIAASAQQTYVEEINSMFQMIRAQRHDFGNHVQTIQSLAQLNRIDELRAYAAELAGETREMNQVMNIGNPAIAALVRAKMSQAESNRIAFCCQFDGFEKLQLGVKSLDLTRLLGNLIDNAFDESMHYPEDRRVVRLSGSLENGMLVFAVDNVCERVGELADRQIFEPGYTTKTDGRHQGLGLAIVKQIAAKYKGTVSAEALEDGGQIRFTVRIPHRAVNVL